MRVDVSEGIDPEEWPPLPTDDRLMVGGRTLWTGPFRPPVVVAQPNRWGVIEVDFPAVPCLVEADPVVTGCLPLPDQVVGFVDRAHRPIPAPSDHETGRLLIDRAARLGKQLTQTRRVRLAAGPVARTLPLLTPRHPDDLIAACADRGVVGLRPLAGMAGGVALSVHVDHRPDQLGHLVTAFREAVTG